MVVDRGNIQIGSCPKKAVVISKWSKNFRPFMRGSKVVKSSQKWPKVAESGRKWCKLPLSTSCTSWVHFSGKCLLMRSVATTRLDFGRVAESSRTWVELSCDCWVMTHTTQGVATPDSAPTRADSSHDSGSISIWCSRHLNAIQYSPFLDTNYAANWNLAD